MRKKKNNNTENIAVGLSSTSGSVLGSVSAKAAMNKIKDTDLQSDDDIVVQNAETSDDVVVISHSHEDVQANVIEQSSPAPVTTPDTNQTETPEPIIIVEPEPNTIVDIMYAGPTPDPDPIDPNVDPIVCVYGPPEPDILNDVDDPTDDFFTGI